MIDGLRFIERDGKRILQYTAPHAGWTDVELVMREEPTVTITRIQFFAAVEALNFNEKGTRNAVDYIALARKLGLGDGP